MPALIALRPHHWVKNLLLFLPLLLAHSFDPGLFLRAGLGFIAFCAAASITYILNDLMDIEADRAHPDKCKRPFASGALPVKAGPVLIVLLLVAGLLSILPLPPPFWGAAAGYLAASTLYSFWLKRLALVDVFVLASLYTLRIIAGGWAVDVPVSNWLLGVSVFMFTSLAFAKRGIELHKAPTDKTGLVPGRGYMCGDLPLITQMGVAAAYGAVLLLILYFSGGKVRELYARPDVLWLICPVLMYWLSRFWIKVHRGELEHDPLVDAMKDPVSLLCGALIFVIAFIAM